MRYIEKRGPGKSKGKGEKPYTQIKQQPAIKRTFLGFLAGRSKTICWGRGGGLNTRIGGIQ